MVTWTVHQITCDPQTVLATIVSYELGATRPRDGELYYDRSAISAGVIRKVAIQRYFVEMAVDPAAILADRARMDVALGQLRRQPVTLKTAMTRRATEKVSGKITLTLDTHATGDAWRLIRTIKLETLTADGTIENERRVENVIRRQVAGAGITD